MLIKTKNTVGKSLAVMGALLVGIVFISCLSTSEQALALRGGLAAVDVGADVVKSTRETKARAEAEAAAKAEEEQRIAEEKARQEAMAKAQAEEEAKEEAKEEARRLAKEEEQRKLAEEQRKLAEAAEPEYRELLNKAKEYEKKGQMFYALAYYVDALMVPNAANEEAKERFTTIGKLFTWYSLPGVEVAGQFAANDDPTLEDWSLSGVQVPDRFAEYNAWVALLEDAEKYWSEYPPFYFAFNLEEGDLNYENQTASYHLYVDVSYNEKYELLMNRILLPSLSSAYRDGWKKIPKNWPLLSIHDEGNAGKHLVKGAALLEHESKFYNPWMLYYTTNSTFFNEKISSGVYTLQDKLNNGYIGWIEGTEVPYRERDIDYTFYDIKCSILDYNGEKLLTSKRFLVAPYGSQNGYVFEGVSQSVDHSRFIIEGLYLQYGKLDTQKVGREFIKNLEEVTIPISNINQRYANSEAISDLYQLVRDSRGDGGVGK